MSDSTKTLIFIAVVILFFFIIMVVEPYIKKRLKEKKASELIENARNTKNLNYLFEYDYDNFKKLEFTEEALELLSKARGVSCKVLDNLVAKDRSFTRYDHKETINGKQLEANRLEIMTYYLEYMGKKYFNVCIEAHHGVPCWDGKHMHYNYKKECESVFCEPKDIFNVFEELIVKYFTININDYPMVKDKKCSYWTLINVIPHI